MKNTQEWATIGGRIEDYAFTYNNDGKRASKREIFEDYGTELGGLVYAGLVVFVNQGASAYYGGK